MGYDNEYIVKYAQFAQSNTTCSIRNEVFNTMISIVRSIDGQLKGDFNS